jgi:hypothetical protein
VEIIATVQVEVEVLCLLDFLLQYLEQALQGSPLGGLVAMELQTI